MDDSQDLDDLISAWHEADGPLLTGKEAIDRFEPLSAEADEWPWLSEAVSVTWNLAHLDRISDSLSIERIEDLRAGASPTEEEIQLYVDEGESRATSAELVTIYRLATSDEEQEVWLFLVLDGTHPDATVIDAAGPFLQMETVLDAVAERARPWDGWWIEDGDDDETAQLRSHLETALGTRDSEVR